MDENKKIIVHKGERFTYPNDEMPQPLVDTLKELQARLLEVDMQTSLFKAISGSSAPEVYRLIREDYRKAYVACDETKRKVTAFVLQRYEAATGIQMSWNYDYMNETLVVYSQT